MDRHELYCADLKGCEDVQGYIKMDKDTRGYTRMYKDVQMEYD